LATTLATKTTSRLQVLQILASPAASSAQSQQQQQVGAVRQEHGSSGGRRRGSNGSSGSSDIRRFYGVSELHKALLCVAAAAMYSEDCCWNLQDVLTALDAAVGHAGPAVLSQPELLLSITRLYAQVEQQLLLDMQQQDVLQLQAGQDGMSESATAAAAAAGMMVSGCQHGQLAAPPAPAALLAALERMNAGQLSSLHPLDVAAGWMMSHADVLLGAVRLLLQRWMQLLLTSAAVQVPPGMQGDAAAGANRAADKGVAVPQQQQQMFGELSEQQQELLQAVLAALQQQPAAVVFVLHLVRDCMDPQQQQHQVHTAAWLAVLSAVLASSSNKLESSIMLQAQQQQQYSTAAHSTADDINSSFTMLQVLLAGQFHNSMPAQNAGYNKNSGNSGSSSNGIRLLQLTSKILMSSTCTASWVNTRSSCLLLFACSSCLGAVAAALSTGAAGAAATTSACAEGGNKRELEQLLLQQGCQQVGPTCGLMVGGAGAVCCWF
jgi:hypothetical protein